MVHKKRKDDKSRKVMVSFEPNVLVTLDVFAANHRMNRSEFLATAAMQYIDHVEMPLMTDEELMNIEVENANQE